MYICPKPLLAGDGRRVEVHWLITYPGFQNKRDAGNLVQNGIFFKGGMPGMGYEEGEEIGNNEAREKYGLPKKIVRDIPADDPAGMRSLQDGNDGDLVSLDITVSTPGDQLAVAPGKLEREWESGGRHYFHYVQDHPAVYMPYGIAAARYAVLRDTVRVYRGMEGQAGGEPVKLEIYYHPAHEANLSRFMAAYKDGLRYYSAAFGSYPFSPMRLIQA